MSPFGPCGPCAPCAPVAPVAPGGPCGPAGPCAPCGPGGPCAPADTNTMGNCAVWLVRRFSLLSKEIEIALTGVGTSAIPLFARVPFSQLCTVEVRSSCRYPIELTETALNSFVPSVGALFQVILPSDQEPFT